MGTYKKGIKDGAWTEIDYKNGTRRKANYIKGTPEGEQITYVFPGPMDNNKRLEYINYENCMARVWVKKYGYFQCNRKKLQK